MALLNWDKIISDEELIAMYGTHSLKEMKEKIGVSATSINKRLRSIGARMRGHGVKKQYDTREIEKCQ